MDTGLPSASATTFDAVSATVSATVYLIVGAAALIRAPRDIRVRVFFATAVASAPPYLVTALLWSRGSSATFTLPVTAVVVGSLMFGSLALLHFTQVFPWRRPWIRAHHRWLVAGYLFVPIAVAVPAWLLGTFFEQIRQATGVVSTGAGGLGAVSVGLPESLALLLVVMPAVFVVGLAVPFAGLLSIYKSWLAARAAGIAAARVPSLGILVSQMGGGVLTVLIIPLLHLIAPTGPWVTIAALLLFAFGLLMPLAFAAGIWKYDVLALDPDAPPEGV